MDVESVDFTIRWSIIQDKGGWYVIENIPSLFPYRWGPMTSRDICNSLVQERRAKVGKHLESMTLWENTEPRLLNTVLE